jgi:hypothetical protein
MHPDPKLVAELEAELEAHRDRMLAKGVSLEQAEWRLKRYLNPEEDIEDLAREDTLCEASGLVPPSPPAET